MKARHLLFLVLAVLAAWSPYFGFIPAWTPGLATVVALLTVSLIGLNLVFGNTGMLALGQAAFVALPGYIAGMLANLHVPTLLAMAIGLAVSVAVARLVGAVFIRLPGVYFAVGTLGFAFVVEGLARAFPGITGGASGFVFAAGRELSVHAWYAIALAALVVGLGAYAWLVRERFARTLRIVRFDELAAEVMGIDVARVKIRVFTLGCLFSGAGGLLLAYYVGVLVPENAGITRSLEMVGMVMLGGPGSLLGPLLGALVLQWLFVAAGFAREYELLLYGAAFLAAVLYAREGLVGMLHGLWRPRLAAVKTEAGPVADAGGKPRAAATDASLVVRGVSKRFGGVRALEEVSFEARDGEIFALVGPNGAGKTTLFNLISGLEPPSSGTITVAGRSLAGLPVHERAALIGRSFQVPRLVPDLTPAENIMVRLDQVEPALDERARRAAALELLARFGLENVAARPTAQLPAGQRKLVDIVRAAVGRPSLLLLDEPAVGLTEAELTHLAELLAQLRQRRCAIVLVEHNMGFVSRVADRGVVLDRGTVIAEGPIRAILDDPQVRKAYLGVLA